MNLKKQLIKGKLEYDEICTILHNTTKSKYYPLFQTKYQIDERLIDYQDVNKMIELINEFYLFCNENQFKKYIKIICEKRRIDFCRKYKVSQNAKKISLNIVTDDGEELIDKLMDPFFEHENNEIDYRLLSDKDMAFLNLFIDKGRTLTEKEVAKKLGVTQQAISSMLKRIAKRYRNELNQ